MKVLTAAICDWLCLPVPLLNCKAIHSSMHGFISKVWDIWAEVKVSVKKQENVYVVLSGKRPELRDKNRTTLRT